MEDLLQVLSDVEEYEELPVRHNEDQMNSYDYLVHSYIYSSFLSMRVLADGKFIFCDILVANDLIPNKHSLRNTTRNFSVDFVTDV